MEWVRVYNLEIMQLSKILESKLCTKIFQKSWPACQPLTWHFFAETPPPPHGVAPRPPRRPRPHPLPVAASCLSRRAHDPSTPVAPSGWCSRFASPAAAAPPSATPPWPPLFTLDDRFAAADFSPDPTASDLLPVASSPSPRAGAGAGSRSPSWDRSRGKASAPGSPMDGVVEPPPRKELLALPPPSSPWTPPPPTATAVTPATEAARTEPAAPASEGKADGEEWVTLFGKALQKNGIQLCSGVIIGVKHIDPVHRQQLDDRLAGINQGGFMVSLPSKSLVLKSSTGASNQLGALPVGCCNFVFWWVLS
nr:protein enabled homolog [Aegilops tauschii subsp. strangulata]